MRPFFKSVSTCRRTSSWERAGCPSSAVIVWSVARSRTARSLGNLAFSNPAVTTSRLTAMPLVVQQDEGSKELGVTPEHVVHAGPVELLLQRPGTRIVVVDCDIKPDRMASGVYCSHFGVRQRETKFQVVAFFRSFECKRTVVRGSRKDSCDVVFRHDLSRERQCLLGSIGEAEHRALGTRQGLPEVIENERTARAVHEVEFVMRRITDVIPRCSATVIVQH